MKYCSYCGHKLPFETASFCSECGKSLLEESNTDTMDSKSISVANTNGDVFGVGVSGIGHIIGKEIRYTVLGNVYHIHGSENVSKEVITTFQKIKTVPTHIDQFIGNNEEKLELWGNTQHEIKSILEEVRKTEKKEGTPIREIRAGNIQISKSELLLKEYILRGNENLYRTEYSEAIRCYDQALGIDPNYVDAWNGKGLALAILGKDKEAISYFDKALEIDPKYAIAWINKGLALAHLGKKKEAIECYDKALEIDHKLSLGWSNKGSALRDLGKDIEAISYFDKALEIDPKYADAWINKANSLQNLGKDKEAIECYDKALEIDPKSSFAWNNKGFVLAKLGKTHEAFECYAKALEIDPTVLKKIKEKKTSKIQHYE